MEKKEDWIDLDIPITINTIHEQVSHHQEKNGKDLEVSKLWIGTTEHMNTNINITT